MGTQEKFTQVYTYHSLSRHYMRGKYRMTTENWWAGAVGWTLTEAVEKPSLRRTDGHPLYKSRKISEL